MVIHTNSPQLILGCSRTPLDNAEFGISGESIQQECWGANQKIFHLTLSRYMRRIQNLSVQWLIQGHVILRVWYTPQAS